MTENPDTVFAMAGDIVGASTFESFIQNDKPTIDAMNEAGLEVSAAGNHEFDQGYDDLMDRIMSTPTDAEGGADWPYIAANVRLGRRDGAYALETDRRTATSPTPTAPPGGRTSTASTVATASASASSAR